MRLPEVEIRRLRQAGPVVAVLVNGVEVVPGLGGLDLLRIEVRPGVGGAVPEVSLVLPYSQLLDVVLEDDPPAAPVPAVSARLEALEASVSRTVADMRRLQRERGPLRSQVRALLGVTMRLISLRIDAERRAYGELPLSPPALLLVAQLEQLFTQLEDAVDAVGEVERNDAPAEGAGGVGGSNRCTPSGDRRGGVS